MGGKAGAKQQIYTFLSDSVVVNLADGFLALFRRYCCDYFNPFVDSFASFYRFIDEFC